MSNAALAETTSSRALAIARTFAAAFDALKEHAKQNPSEVAMLYESVASHIRSAAPMAMLVGPPPLIDETDAIIDLGEGSLVRLRVLDGKLNMYVCEPQGAHDVNVVLGETPREQLRAALGVVR